MTYRPTPIQTTGTRVYTPTADDALFQLINQMLEQLRMMNLYLSAMSDPELDEAI